MRKSTEYGVLCEVRLAYGEGGISTDENEEETIGASRANEVDGVLSL